MTDKNTVKIIVATHKVSAMPKDDMYVPLQVGAEGKFNSDGTPVDFGYARDNTGKNISIKNYCYGSQTGLYWAWKNIDADYIGLVHYRRFFVGSASEKVVDINNILSGKQLYPMLDNYKIFVPQKRKYYIETIYSQYGHTFDGTHLDIARDIIREKTPEYLSAFDTYMRRRQGYAFNIMILRRDLMNDYCEWLFSILFVLEHTIDTTTMNDFEKRFCGRISERLFNVWLIYQLQIGKLNKSDIKELPYVEDVNWARKVKSFLLAKYFHKKYSASF